MLKSCFGLGQLRSGVNVIAIFNMIFVFGTVFLRSMSHLRMYILRMDDSDFDIHWHRLGQRKPNADDSTDDSTNDSTNKTTPFVTWENAEHISMWIYFAWAIIVFITNVYLKQSTFKQAPYKIYTWLAINYATAIYLACYLVSYLLLLKKYRASQVLVRMFNPYLGDFISIFTLFALFGFEIFVVHSFYIEENKAMSKDVLQLKWKHVSGGQVLSQGNDYTNVSTYHETLSREARGRSKMPPFITNVLLDRN